MDIEPEAQLSRPPRPEGKRFRLRSVILVALMSATAGAFIARSLPAPPAPKSAEDGKGGAALYQCPMHPTIVSDHPSNCPICGMKLVKVEGARPSASAAAPERKVLFYRSPMDPKQTSPTPKKDEMGMDYLPVFEDEASARVTVPGMATVEIDPTRQQLIGLTTAEVTFGPIGGAWKTVGRVAVDETRVRHINLKVAAFVERIYVDFVGKKVKKGDPLFSVYSPELLAAQEEYLVALRSKSAMSQVGAPAGAAGDSLVAAARRKLSLWDVPSSDIDRLASTGAPQKTLTFYSPISGVVTKKDVVQGMKLDAGAMPYEIVDLASVWVLADVYESELRYVKEGMAASLKLNAYPDEEFEGTVAFMDPLLDAASRTVKVRLSFANPKGELRPEMFGEVTLRGVSREAPRVPLDAILDSGKEKIVFVAVGDGKFQPRIVTIGQTDGSFAEVIEGVGAGERVVTRANFLVDSESRLRASLAEMSAPAGAGQAPQSARVLPVVSAPPSSSSSAPAQAPRSNAAAPKPRSSSAPKREQPAPKAPESGHQH